MDVLTVDHLAQVLQEPNRPRLTQVLRTLGRARTTALLADTLTCAANGGMLTKDGSRRRTPGGVFFQLVKEQATPPERQLSPEQLQLISFAASVSVQPRPLLDAKRGEITIVSSKAPARKVAASAVRK